MVTLTKSLVMAAVAISCMAQPSFADPAGTNPVAPAHSNPPVVKIDRAMLQERQTLPDGTTHVETYCGPESTTSAQAACSGVKAPAGKAKA